MRRVMLLTLLTLALPMVAFSDQIRYTTGTNSDASITTFTPDFPTNFTVTVDCLTAPCNAQPKVGPLDVSPVTMTLATTNLDCSGAPFCTFSSGTINVLDSTGPLFTDSLSNGSMIQTSDQAINDAQLVPLGNAVLLGSDVKLNFGFTAATSGNGINGAGQVIVDTVIPEPGTLSLLGTVLIGFGGIAIRKLKLGT